MEEMTQKLIGQLSLLALIAWLAYTAFEKPKPKQKACNGGQRWNPDSRAGGSIWNHSPVAAPSAEEGLAWPAAPLM